MCDKSMAPRKNPIIDTWFGEQTFLKAIRKFPRNSEVLLKYTKHLIERQRLEQAANYLSLAYQESPNNTEIWDVYIKFAGPKDKAIEEEIKKKMN